MLARESALYEWADSLADWACLADWGTQVLNQQGFDPKYASERVKLPFDFTSELAVGETLSTATVVATVWSGVDSSPASIISGSAVIATPLATQLIVAGVEGTIYSLACSVTTSAGQTLKRVGLLAVIPEAP